MITRSSVSLWGTAWPFLRSQRLPLQMPDAFLQHPCACRLKTNKSAPLRGTFSNPTHRYPPPLRSHEKYSRSRRDLLRLPHGFSSVNNQLQIQSRVFGVPRLRGPQVRAHVPTRATPNID